ncbi:DNA-binding response regulator [Deltaproteobacteria bacterium Smac51]|nr:DNA-binding response regulator [Deltaproteobacteria bacterium Smac51]
MVYSILLADDHDVVRHGLRSLLEIMDEFEVAGEAANGRLAVEAAARLRPDIILMDLIMPEMDGVTAIRQIVESLPDSHVAVLTSTDDDRLAFAAIEAGARSYLLKNMMGDELLSALKRIAAGENVIHPRVAQRILDVVRHGFDPVPVPFTELTAREIDVLKELANGGSNAGIAQKLSISEKTVKTHLSSVLGKLQLKDRTEAAAYAWREGLLKADVRY